MVVYLIEHFKYTNTPFSTFNQKNYKIAVKNTSLSDFLDVIVKYQLQNHKKVVMTHLFQIGNCLTYICMYL